MNKTLYMLRSLYERANHPCTRIEPADLKASDTPLDIESAYTIIRSHISLREANAYLLGRVQEMKRLRTVMMMMVAEGFVANTVDDSDHRSSNYYLTYTHELTGALEWGRYGGYELSGLAMTADTPMRREHAASALLGTDIVPEVGS